MAGRDRAAQRGHGRSRGRPGRISAEGSRRRCRSRNKVRSMRTRLVMRRSSAPSTRRISRRRHRTTPIARLRNAARRRRTRRRCRTSRRRCASTPRCTRPTRTSATRIASSDATTKSLKAYDQALKINPDTPYAIEYQGEAFLAPESNRRGALQLPASVRVDPQHAAKLLPCDARVGGSEQGETASGHRCAGAGGLGRGASRGARRWMTKSSW